MNDFEVRMQAMHMAGFDFQKAKEISDFVIAGKIPEEKKSSSRKNAKISPR